MLRRFVDFRFGAAFLTLSVWALAAVAQGPAGAGAWFRMEGGQPTYPRVNPPGLHPAYGEIGKNGLVWHAGFDWSLDFRAVDPDDPSRTLSVLGRFGSESAALEEGPQFVQGLIGRAFLSPSPASPDAPAHVTFDGLDRITAAPRGTIVVWMYTKDAYRPSNNVFWTGAFALRMWWEAQMHIEPHQHYMNTNLVEQTINLFNGWNMFAVTWDQTGLRVYMNGVLVDETTHKVAGITLFGVGTAAEQKPRLYDEAAIYTRVLSGSELRQQYLALLKPQTQPRMAIPRAAPTWSSTAICRKLSGVRRR